MKTTLEKLWDEYLFSECAVLDTDEERSLTKKADELHKKMNSLTNNEQQAIIEKYIDALYDLEDLFVKKAFVKGCEFAVSFLLESGEGRLFFREQQAAPLSNQA